jgi:hypothetical protein
MLKQNTLSELSMCAAAALIACCWSGRELAVRRGDAPAAHWRHGAVAGGERRVETDITVDDEFYYAARAERLCDRCYERGDRAVTGGAFDCALRCMISTAGRTEECQASEGEKASGQRLTSGRAPASSRLLCTCRGQQLERIQSNNTCLEESFLSVGACHRLNVRAQRRERRGEGAVRVRMVCCCWSVED